MKYNLFLFIRYITIQFVFQINFQCVSNACNIVDIV